MAGEQDLGQSLDSQRVADAAHHLISSRRVEGTPVYNRQGEKLRIAFAYYGQIRGGAEAPSRRRTISRERTRS